MKGILEVGEMTHVALNDNKGEMFEGGVMRRVGVFVFILFMSLFVSNALVYVVEAAPPTYTPLTSVSMTSADGSEIWGARIAVDKFGELFILDRFNSKVRVFHTDTDGTGSDVQNEISEIAYPRDSQPTAIAVDANGRLIVAEGDGSIKIYEKAYNADHTAISGWTNVASLTPALSAQCDASAGRNFCKVTDIEVASDGKLYVVDSQSRNILVFGSDLQYSANLTATINAGLALISTSDTVLKSVVYKPVSVVESGGVLYIGDCPLEFSSAANAYAYTSRIIKLNLGTNAVSAFRTPFFQASTGKYLDHNEGNISFPAGLVVSGGYIYVADPGQFAIQIFDLNGTYQGCTDSNADGVYDGCLYVSNNLMRTVNDIAMGKDKVIYVSSINTHDVKRFAVSGAVQVNPDEMFFEAMGASAITVQSANVVRPNSSGAMSWTAVGDASWLCLSNDSNWTPQSGCVQSLSGSQASGVGASSFYVGINQVGLLKGVDYTGSVRVCNSTSGACDSVAVTVRINAGSLVCGNNAPIPFTVEDGAPSYCSSCSLVTTDGSPVPATVAIDCASGSCPAWLTVARRPSSNVVDFCATEGGSAAGFFDSETVAFSDPSSVLLPAHVNTSLSVVSPASGTITVNTNIDSCFTVTGQFTPAAVFNACTVGGVWTSPSTWGGCYDVVYLGSPAYFTPPSESKCMSAGGSITFSGTFKRPRIATAMGAGSMNVSEVRVLDLNGTQTASFTAFDAARVMYGARVAMGDVDGDGADEIIVAKGEGSVNNSEVKVFRLDGTPLGGANFIAFSTLYMNGARVAAIDFDGDGLDEIVVGTSENRALVRVLKYDVVSHRMIDTGVMFNAFPSASYGVNIATAKFDVTSDQIPDPVIVTTTGPGKLSDPQMKIWRVNAGGAVGAWSVVDTGITIPVSGALLADATGYGASVAAYKTIIAAGTGAGGGVVEIYDTTGWNSCSIPLGEYNGACSNPSVRNMTACTAGGGVWTAGSVVRQSDGVDLAVGDMNADGSIEILVGLGAGSNAESKLIVFGADTCNVKAPYTMNPFPAARFGARASIGHTGN